MRLLPSAPHSWPPPLRAQQYDILITGGTVYDGTGALIATDLGIRGDRIVFVGKAAARATAQRIDAKGPHRVARLHRSHTHAYRRTATP
jgi:N-acyl-D-aspartate/D-glutamate deacylase